MKSPESGKPDFQLVREFQDGDETAFDAIVLRHQDLVYNLSLRILGSRDDADDASQETFIKAYKGLRSFRYASSLTTWLYRVCVNTCKNRMSSLSHRMSRRSLSLDAEKPDGTRVVSEPGDETWSPAVLGERAAVMEAVAQAISRLPEDQRVVVVLADVEGRPYEEIAVIAGLNVGTVKSKLSRARQVLKERLREVI